MKVADAIYDVWFDGGNCSGFISIDECKDAWHVNVVDPETGQLLATVRGDEVQTITIVEKSESRQ